MTTREETQILVPHQGTEHVSALIDLPDGAARAVFVLAHGAGAPMTSEFLEEIAPRIASAAGVAVLRFNYAYAERMARTGKRLPPERRPALEAVHGAAFAFARSRFADIPLIGGGKSLGGRMASLMAAEGAEVDGLIFLGYPLHPAGKQERLRTEHFPRVAAPALFLQGTRDALANLDLLRPALETWGAAQTLHVVEGADHSFSVLRRGGRTPEDVFDEITTAAATWVDGLIEATSRS